ncbi:MAG TPA: hypothetical protein PLL28_13505 [Chitinophagales bacterium]|nr:hypothetical protein [Chitinophagales bacterium]HNE47407.1 hypothetical protein [Chitinophagales bacterium]HNF70391.1 hypothetical protein [Chitinophagales bacterium]HNJ90730.1 hypothetical protein [Chitinophagales bacterium]HNK99350.1 hypothetical protein [Chitinophagales bacterium]
MSAVKSSIIALLFMCSYTLQAQISVEVSESVSAMSLGDRTGYAVTIPRSTEKNAAKAFRSWIIEKQKKADINESAKHELRVTNFAYGPLGSAPVNVYFQFNEGKDGVIVVGYFEVNGTFVSTATNPDAVAGCKQFMTHFAYRMEKLAIAENLDAEKKALEKRNDEQAGLEKQQKALNDKIADCEETIAKAKDDLKTNAGDQETKQQEIKYQSKKVSEVEDALKVYDNY